MIYRLPDDWCSNYIHETMVVQMTWVWTFSTIYISIMSIMSTLTDSACDHANDSYVHLLCFTYPCAYSRRALPFQESMLALVNAGALCKLFSTYLRGTLVSPKGHSSISGICKSMQFTLHNGALSISLFYLHICNVNIRGAYGGVWFVHIYYYYIFAE